ncbi:MAG TPA: ABC transporter ATP-binding protein [Anaerolineae bacterium]|nr:ABC transporter ATP-binding protein [Anaerolineae bacterium]
MFDWFRKNGKHNGRNGHHLSAGEVQAPHLTEAMISLRGITKAYDTDAGPFWALKGIDLQVYPGEFVSVVGKSGSGKSTLINMFTGIDHPTDGEVVVAQTHVRRLDEGQMAEWRGRHMGIVFQFFQLLPTLTLAENVMLPMDLCQMYDPNERYERALHVLDQVGVADDAAKFPAAVSGGHQQRAAIARALANDPPIVVADEPTGNLDSRTADAVFHLFESLVAEGKTILMVTHDGELARRVPRTLTLADGLIVDEEVRFAADPVLTWTPEMDRPEPATHGPVRQPYAPDPGGQSDLPFARN